MYEENKSEKNRISKLRVGNELTYRRRRISKYRKYLTQEEIKSDLGESKIDQNVHITGIFFFIFCLPKLSFSCFLMHPQSSFILFVLSREILELKVCALIL